MQWRAAEEIGLVGIGGLWAYMEGDKGRIGMNWEQLKEVWVRNVWQFWCKPACIGLEGLVLKAQIDSIGLSGAIHYQAYQALGSNSDRSRENAWWCSYANRQSASESVLGAGRSMPSQQRCVYSFDAIHEWLAIAIHWTHDSSKWSETCLRSPLWFISILLQEFCPKLFGPSMLAMNIRETNNMICLIVISVYLGFAHTYVRTRLRRPWCNTSGEGAGHSSCVPWLPQAEPPGQPAPGQWRKTQKGHRGQQKGARIN